MLNTFLTKHDLLRLSPDLLSILTEHEKFKKLNLNILCMILKMNDFNSIQSSIFVGALCETDNFWKMSIEVLTKLVQHPLSAQFSNEQKCMILNH